MQREFEGFEEELQERYRCKCDASDREGPEGVPRKYQMVCSGLKIFLTVFTESLHSLPFLTFPQFKFYSIII